MLYKIVGDSCCDYTELEINSEQFINIPLSIQVDEHNIIDDYSFDQEDFLNKVAKSPNCPKSACPAPDVYMDAYMQGDDIYVVTLSAELSGSYNSAELAKRLYIEEHGQKNIHVFNSCSASCGQLLICRFIDELAKKGTGFSTVVEKTEEYIKNLRTYFVLESLETLRKNGRLSNVKAAIASVLNIKPVMGADKGTIVQLSQARGITKAVNKMIETMIKDVQSIENKDIMIAHCNCLERAKVAKEYILSKCSPKSVGIIDTKGISSLYANDGGIIMCV